MLLSLMINRRIAFAFLTLALVMLGGCATYEQLADDAMARSCSVSGQKARDGFRAVRGPEYVMQDKAICIRCPGEDALKCTGDPKALP